MIPSSGFRLRDHQEHAVEAALRGLDEHHRVLVTMPCGTGKTAVAAELARRSGGTVALFVPTLALVRQSIAAFRRHLGDELGEVVVVATETGLVEAGLSSQAASCEADLVASALSKFGRGRGGVDLVVCTYHSAPVLAEAQRRSRGAQRFSLVVCDEAHRLAGNPDARFVAAHREVRATDQVFLTATPVTTSDGRAGWIPVRGVVSMDDETMFGPRVYDLTLAEARTRGLLCDWKVLVCAGEESDTGTVTAVLAAAAEHKLTRIMVFSSRVRLAARLSDAFNTAGVCSDGRAVRAQVVHSGMSAPRRARAVAELDEATGEQVEIVCNVDCLTEGVDVAQLDAVVFTSEKTSKVSVVQSLGRVLRCAPGKEHGYVIVPVGVACDEPDVDGAMRAGRFGCLWSILRSLRDVDDEFAAQLDRRRARGTGTGSCDLDRLELRFDPDVAARIATVAVESCSDTWWEWYRRLAEHVGEHGWGGMRQADASLETWCGTQRRARVNGLLQADRVAALEQLPGWWWVGGFANVHEFATRLAEALESAQVGAADPAVLHGTGGIEVPGWRRPVGVLAAWVRLTRRRGLLPQPLEQRFAQIPGWRWSVIDPGEEQMVELLARFRAFEGHVEVPREHLELGEPLGETVREWRVRHAAGTLPVAVVHEVEAAGGPTWRWRRDETAFEVMCELLAERTGKLGHTLGIGDEVVESVLGPFPLGRWVSRMRHQHRRGLLDEARVAALEAIPGWSWSGVAPREKREIGQRRHGTRSGYGAGCRCEECTASNKAYNDALSSRGGSEPTLVEADASAAKLAELVEAGLSTRALAKLLGMSRSSLEQLQQGRRRRVTLETAAKLSGVDAEGLFAQVVARAGEDSFLATVRVPAGPTWARVEEMVAAGRSKTGIAREAGLGASIQLRRDRITAGNAAKIAEVYQQWVAQRHLPAAA